MSFSVDLLVAVVRVQAQRHRQVDDHMGRQFAHRCSCALVTAIDSSSSKRETSDGNAPSDTRTVRWPSGPASTPCVMDQLYQLRSN